MLRTQRPARASRDAPRRRGASPDPNLPPFSSYLERDREREKRDRSKKRTLLLSLGLHILAVAAVLVYSFLNVDELFGPSVKVKLFTPGKLPAGVSFPAAPAPQPAPAPPPAR